MTTGKVIADAMLFVAAGAQPANLLYVHPDHLGSPQKLTDASQATVWDGVFDPFGEEVAIAGLAAMPLRFPGQYADEETGYSYNYFRDYEPALGRYIQSDPIGLAGGLNTFAYVRGSPFNLIDPFGLDWYGTDQQAPSSSNTIVCDGTGGIMTQVAPNSQSTQCGVNECTRVHEEVHRRDALESNPNACAGKPRGGRVFTTPGERAASEVAASEAELVCLRKKLAETCDKFCIAYIQARINTAESYRDQFR